MYLVLVGVGGGCVVLGGGGEWVCCGGGGGVCVAVWVLCGVRQREREYSTCAHTYIRIYCMYVCLYVHVHLQVYVCTYVCVCVPLTMYCSAQQAWPRYHCV